MLEFCDIFEAGQDIERLDAVFGADLLQQVGRDDGLDKELLAVKFTQFVPTRQEVACDERGNLVASQQNQLAFVVPDGTSYAVGIRVSTQGDIGPDFIGALHDHAHGRRFLRIR